MLRYLSGDELRDTIKVDGETIFRKGCFNCTNLKERCSKVSGKCKLIKQEDFLVWKDFTCDRHNSIKQGN